MTIQCTELTESELACANPLAVFFAIKEMKELELCFKSANSVPFGRVILQDKKRVLINAGVKVLNHPFPHAGEYFYSRACYIDLDDFMRVKRGFNRFGLLKDESNSA